MSEAPVAPPATFVIFGAMGDLTRRLLVPALVNLTRAKLLDPDTRIIGISHGDGDDAALRGRMSGFVEDGAEWQDLAGRISYLQGDFGDDALFETLTGKLKGNAVFYLATAPDFFGPVVEHLGKAGLLDE